MPIGKFHFKKNHECQIRGLNVNRKSDHKKKDYHQIEILIPKRVVNDKLKADILKKGLITNKILFKKEMLNNKIDFKHKLNYS